MKDYIESESGIKLNDVIDGKSDEGKKIKPSSTSQGKQKK